MMKSCPGEAAPAFVTLTPRCVAVTLFAIKATQLCKAGHPLDSATLMLETDQYIVLLAGLEDIPRHQDGG